MYKDNLKKIFTVAQIHLYKNVYCKNIYTVQNMRHMIYIAFQRVSMFSNISLLYLFITNSNYSDMFKKNTRSYDRVLLQHIFFLTKNIYRGIKCVTHTHTHTHTHIYIYVYVCVVRTA